MTCLIGFEIIDITGSEVLNQLKLEKIAYYLGKYLPNYYLAGDNRILEIDDLIVEKSESYILIDIPFIEFPLSEEISNSGLSDFLLNDYSILRNLPRSKWSDYSTITNFLVVDLIYDKDYCPEYACYEYNTTTEIIGYLDSNKELILI